MENTYNVREIIREDIPLFINYWLNSPDEHLLNMGVDLSKKPSENQLYQLISHQFDYNYNQKQNYALVWLKNNRPIGHCNINTISFGQKANMHLHIWKKEERKKGIGSILVTKSLHFFFEKMKLKEVICEPYALNPAPNQTLKKIGFQFIKKHRCIPGGMNFEQDVNQWRITKEKFTELYG